jgi:hypothetical protein
MTSFDTDRRIVDVFFGLIHGIDVWVFVLLKDDVEPPVDVDCRCKFDGAEPNDERRFVETGGFSRVFVVGGRIMGTRRWVRDWIFVVGGGFDGGAVAGRAFVGLTFTPDGEVVVPVCLFREGGIRGATIGIGTEGWNKNKENCY